MRFYAFLLSVLKALSLRVLKAFSRSVLKAFALKALSIRVLKAYSRSVLKAFALSVLIAFSLSVLKAYARRFCARFYAILRAAGAENFYDFTMFLSLFCHFSNTSPSCFEVLRHFEISLRKNGKYVLN
jgi:hypothetical protein